MSKIDKLIQELCPDGVVFKHIWEVTTWDKKFNAVDNHKQPKVYKYTYLLASKLRKLAVDGGDVKLLSTGGELYGFTTEDIAGDSMSEGEIISIPWGGKATVQYYKGKFVTADNRIATSLDKEYLDNKYLYYFMLSNLREIQSFYRGSGIQHPSMTKVLDMKLPIPPLEVQKEIVNILDKFTQLEAELSAELSAELEARRKQYKFYRNQLLTFDDRVKYLKLADIMNKTSGTKVTAAKMKDLHKEGAPVKIFAGGKTYAHFEYSDLPEKDINTKPSVVVKSRGFIEFEYIDTPFSHKNEFWSYNCKNENINTKFVYYFLKNNEPYFQRLGGMMQMPQISSGDTNNFKIPIPSLDDQARIVEILDKFDDLTNSIAKGLPAEIAARRKQYEYYRTKLLAFKELV